MKFFDVFKRKKLLFFNIFLFLYIAINLFTGDRGLLSYFEKREIKENLLDKKNVLIKELSILEHKNKLLSENLNYDLVDTLIIKLND